MTTNTPSPSESEEKISPPLSTRRKVLFALWTLITGGWLFQLKKRSDRIDSERFEIELQKKDKAVHDSYAYAIKQLPNGDDKKISEVLSNKFNELYRLAHLPNLNLRWRKIKNHIIYLPTNAFDGMDPLAVWWYEILENWDIRRIEYNDADELRQKFNIQYWEK